MKDNLPSMTEGLRGKIPEKAALRSRESIAMSPMSEWLPENRYYLDQHTKDRYIMHRSLWHDTCMPPVWLRFLRRHTDEGRVA